MATGLWIAQAQRDGALGICTVVEHKQPEVEFERCKATQIVLAGGHVRRGTAVRLAALRD
jgi:hypothetical protein